MEIIGKRLSLHEFQDYVSTFDFGPKLPDKLVIHHTWKPTRESWDGQRTIGGLKRYYEGKGWPAGPHLFIADDGIWLFSTMRKDGIHAGNLNHLSIGIEVVGDYDNAQWEGQTKYNTLGVITVLSQRFNLQRNQLFFHRDVSSKSCPGNAITKEWLFAELDSFRILPRIPEVPTTETPVTPDVPSIPETTPAMEGVTSVSAPLPEMRHASTPPPGLNALDEDVMIPIWAAEAVAWVHKNHLFEIHTHEDVHDAVKFHRLYNLMQNS